LNGSDVEGYETYESARVRGARTTARLTTLGTLPSGTNPTFLAGADHRPAATVPGKPAGLRGTFISAIPQARRFCANGKHDPREQANSSPTASHGSARILSVVLEGDAVRAEFKHHSNAAIHIGPVA